VNSKSILVRGDYEDYLVRVYFGPRFIRSQDFLGACIDRAYLDFNRTLRGLSKFDGSRALSESAASMVKKALGALETACAHGISAAEFDNWHRCACEGLISKYADSGYARLHVGQAQKWINMSLKYVFVLGEQRVSGFGEAYPFCHAILTPDF
jgi:hypothetical protein